MSFIGKKLLVVWATLIEIHTSLNKVTDFVSENNLNDENIWVLKIDRKLISLSHKTVFSFLNSHISIGKLLASNGILV